MSFPGNYVLLEVHRPFDNNLTFNGHYTQETKLRLRYKEPGTLELTSQRNASYIWILFALQHLLNFAYTQMGCQIPLVGELLWFSPACVWLPTISSYNQYVEAYWRHPRGNAF